MRRITSKYSDLISLSCETPINQATNLEVIDEIEDRIMPVHDIINEDLDS